MTNTNTLHSLVQRSRNRLWVRRLLRSLWYGSCAAAAVLLLLSLIHILFAPVPVHFWLPAGAMPVMLTILHTALAHRPSCTDAVTELDREGGHNDLLISAWEMLAMAPGERPAGAGPVLQRAGDACRRADPPLVLTENSHWRGRYRSMPWLIMIPAIFLLQLSTTPLRSELPEQASTGYIRGDMLRPREITENSLSAAASHNETAMTGNAPEARAGTAGMPAGEHVRRVANPPTDAATGEPRPGGLAVISGGRNETEQDDINGVSPSASSAEPASADLPSARFEEIARATKGERSRATGQGSAIFEEPHDAPEDWAGTEQMPVVAKATGVRTTNLFSLSQRVQIKAYFDRLEETP